jgi:hypothetical protein
MSKKILIISLLALIFIPIVNAEITYIETYPTWLNLTTLSNNIEAWYDYDIFTLNAIPKGAVVEIIGCNPIDASNYYLGVRIDGSTLERRILLNEAEDGGNTTTRFIATVDNSTGLIEVWGDNDWLSNAFPSYYIVGYWNEITFIEQWVKYEVTGAEDGGWWITDGIELSLQPDKTHLISITNDAVGTELGGGVRKTVETRGRWAYINEAEGGGNSTISLYVQSDTSNKISVFSAVFDDVRFYNQGYMNNSNIEFMSYYDYPSESGYINGNWEVYNLYGVIVPRNYIADFLCMNDATGLERNVGVRENGTTVKRYIQVREAESGVFASYGMTVNTDDAGAVEVFGDDYGDVRHTFIGYFIIDTTETVIIETTVKTLFNNPIIWLFMALIIFVGWEVRKR